MLGLVPSGRMWNFGLLRISCVAERSKLDFEQSRRTSKFDLEQSRRTFEVGYQTLDISLRAFNFWHLNPHEHAWVTLYTHS
jgi:hypothetical protein